METDKNITIVSCSGASNTGKYTDEVARRISAFGIGNMLCLAKVAIGDSTLIENTKRNKSKLIVLDGCPVNCAEKIMNQTGFECFTHLKTTSFEIVKGVSPLTEDKIQEIIQHIQNLS